MNTVAKASLSEDDLRAHREGRLAEAEEAVRLANEHLEKVQLRTVLACDHPHAHIAEAPFQKLEFLNSLPPFRVCLRCGLHEGGWGSGYHMLRGDDGYNAAIEIDRNVAYGFRTLSVADLAASEEEEEHD